ncbi:unnamed protein product [Anisakis simplex]|uniref:Aminoglycoside phosphotransferase n=1 Tax=Anisakis simplex TaxID=6269 RepID=A0A0M3JIR8_ANISI|nr:unnamed protein product [Anisakis simplex]
MNTRIHNTTPITEDDPWWRAFSAALAEENCPVKTEIFLGSTDSRYLRQVNFLNFEVIF